MRVDRLARHLTILLFRVHEYAFHGLQLPECLLLFPQGLEQVEQVKRFGYSASSLVPSVTSSMIRSVTSCEQTPQAVLVIGDLNS